MKNKTHHANEAERLLTIAGRAVSCKRELLAAAGAWVEAEFADDTALIKRAKHMLDRSIKSCVRKDVG